ncbi:MAG: glycoside hydrolase family 97 catalytic domain-containing protein [Bacteroides sp.]|nr:glycoside hydrolase family 97 catalytic domain-containing protein [Bacteroides sp.]
MNKNKLKVLAGSLLIILTCSCQQNPGSWELESPDQQILVKIDLSNTEETAKLQYSVSRQIEGTYVDIMDPSPLGIEREDTRFVSGLELESVQYHEGVEDQYTLVSGKKLNCSNTYNDIQITLKNLDNKRMVLNFRAYDYGIAFSYNFPGKSENNVRVIRELSGFDFKEGNFWAHAYDTLTKWNPAYETYYEGPVPVGTMAPWNKNGWAFPILIESKDTWMLVSEAGFDGSYGASHLQPECEDGAYMIRFAEQGEAEGYFENTSHSTLPWNTPWRFIAIGATPSELVETTLPTDLSAPSAIDDVSWIKPGRASWSWWSDDESPQDYDRILPFIDLAAEMGWEYSLVDANWNLMKNGNIGKLVKYANEKNVGLLVWYNSGGKHNVVEEEPRDLMDDPKARKKEFERISKMGIKGIKVDFFQSDKQEIIGQYVGILEDAAEFGLLVNFHGCTLPKGWRRTWPNLVSMEAVKGGECYRFSSDFPEKAPIHLSILPFSRNAVGPCDYTPGGYTDSKFPHLSTYGFELALPVVIESGVMHHMDTPAKTLGLPPYAVEFLKDIPVVWDDTRYIAGYPGKDVVIARKKGDQWYIGGINGENQAKEITIDLSVTGEAPAELELIVDGKSARDLQTSIMQTKDGKLTIKMQAYGGFAGSWTSQR